MDRGTGRRHPGSRSAEEPIREAPLRRFIDPLLVVPYRAFESRQTMAEDHVPICARILTISDRIKDSSAPTVPLRALLQNRAHPIRRLPTAEAAGGPGSSSHASVLHLRHRAGEHPLATAISWRSQAPGERGPNLAPYHRASNEKARSVGGHEGGERAGPVQGVLEEDVEQDGRIERRDRSFSRSFDQAGPREAASQRSTSTPRR